MMVCGRRCKGGKGRTDLVIDNHKVLFAFFIDVTDSCEEQACCRILRSNGVEGMVDSVSMESRC